jgi:hypothetical protein
MSLVAQDLIGDREGNDVLPGGWGVDTLRGGVGSDFVFSSGNDGFVLPTDVNHTPRASQGEELARGCSTSVTALQTGMSHVRAR